MSPLKLETVPADCWDWITPDDVVRHALAAFYGARQRIKASEGPWFDAESCTGWSRRSDFRDELAGLFAQRINVQAHELGIRQSPCSIPRDLPFPMLWDGQVFSTNDAYAMGRPSLAGGRPEGSCA